MALPKKYRLALGKKRISGKIYRSPFFTLVVANDESKNKRLAFVLGTKIAKKAVLRNKIRRKLQQDMIELLPKMKPGDYILYVKKAILGGNPKQIKDELGRIFL